MTTENQAPEGADERAAFETWMKVLPGYPYAGKFADRMWQGWQARAALAAQPQAVALTDDATRDLVAAARKVSAWLQSTPLPVPTDMHDLMSFAVSRYDEAHGITQTKEPTNDR